MSAATPGQFLLSSSDIEADSVISNTHVFNQWGCIGANISPALSWTGAPAETRGYAVTCFDPDAPSGSGWWHWMVYDIPAATGALQTGAGNEDSSSLPPGAKQGMTDYGVKRWGGPCPPPGDEPHRYVFTVFALGVPTLDVPENATSAALGFEIRAHALAEASFTAFYGR
jgi:Raf kinase inhibitor-like YbhB/YbcL family protein